MRTPVAVLMIVMAILLFAGGVEAGPNFLDGVMPAPLQLALLQDPATETPAQIYSTANNIPIFVSLTVVDSVTKNFAFNNYRPFTSQNDWFRFFTTVSLFIMVPILIFAFFQLCFNLHTCRGPNKSRKSCSDSVTGIYSVWSLFRVAVLIVFGVIIVVYMVSYSASVTTFMFLELNIGLQLLWWIGWMYIALGLAELAVHYAMMVKGTSDQAPLRGAAMQRKLDNVENGMSKADTKSPDPGYIQGDLDSQLFARLDRRVSNFRMVVYAMISFAYWLFAFTSTNQTYSKYMGVTATSIGVTVLFNLLMNGESITFKLWTVSPSEAVNQTLWSFSFFSDWNIFLLVGAIFVFLFPEQPVLIFFVTSNGQWYEGFVVFGLVLFLSLFVLISIASIWFTCKVDGPKSKKPRTLEETAMIRGLGPGVDA